MSNVATFELGKKPQYITSGNTPEYCDIPVEKGTIFSTSLLKSEMWQYAKSSNLLNPNLSNVENVPIKYWKRDGDSIVEMNEIEKAAADLL